MPAAETGLHLPAGSAADAPWSVAVTPEAAGWSYAGIHVLDLAPGMSHTFDTGASEAVVLPLSGSCTVTCGPETADLTGRSSVFDRVTDFAYVPLGSHVTVRSAAGGRFAVPSARARRALPFRYGAADDVPVEVRGAGACTRQVNNFCAADVFDADRLIAVEVLTPAANWSSYPPHKHDEAAADESVLEEVYYYEVSDGPASADEVARPGMAYQRVYGRPGRPVDVLAEVRSGDVVLIPHGWHGPSMAVPGYDLYYLNVMAGPDDERVWRIRDDPAHAWVRDTWTDQRPDPRLPMTTSGGRR
ncbi:MAG: 5-deoxy-glucuronate isomerase [Actinomycetes bacterium]